MIKALYEFIGITAQPSPPIQSPTDIHKLYKLPELSDSPSSTQGPAQDPIPAQGLLTAQDPATFTTINIPKDVLPTETATEIATETATETPTSTPTSTPQQPQPPVNLKYQTIENKYNINTTTSISDSIQSETSPFISSEMYNYLVNKNQLDNNIQKGGGNKQKGGALDESSTSNTSDSSTNMMRKCKNCKQPVKAEKGQKGKGKPIKVNKSKGKPEVKPEVKPEETKPVETKPVETKPSDTDSDYDSEDNNDDDDDDDDDNRIPNIVNDRKNMIGKETTFTSKNKGSNSDVLSYISSPGNSNSEELSGGSISNNNDYLPPSSINTTDINMISESS
jgi:hypothetical protein